MFLTIAFFVALLADDWLQFRGSDGSGITKDLQVPITWGGVFERAKWEKSLPGRGWSSPIVVGDRIWLTSSEQVLLEQSKASDKIAKRPFDAVNYQTHASVSLFALEIDAETGNILRRIDLFESVDPPPIHAWNSYASPTPVSDGKHVYCHFGSLGTACIEMESGDILWRREFNVDDITGSGASPVLCGDLLCVACDGADEQYLIAVDKRSGETRWRADRPSLKDIAPEFRRAFSTPLSIESNGSSQLVSMSARWLLSNDPKDGRELWRANVGSGYSAVPRPIFQDGKVFVCTGYSKPELVAVRVDGKGDVTHSHIAWRFESQVPELASPIAIDDQIYFASVTGIMTSVKVSSGEKIWQHRVGGRFAASPTYAGGHIYWTSMEGVTTVIRPGDRYEEVARNELFGESYASLAVYRNRFLLRTSSALFCLEKTDK